MNYRLSKYSPTKRQEIEQMIVEGREIDDSIERLEKSLKKLVRAQDSVSDRSQNDINQVLERGNRNI